MLIAVDGACKRNGKPDCSSVGVAWIITDEDMLYKSRFEPNSTNQRGEINGLIQALQYAANDPDKTQNIIIITDSQYLYNSVTLDWAMKWRSNDWIGATGPVKNKDQWEIVCRLLGKINADYPRVYMEWTKGHLMSYTPGNTKKAMIADDSGITLYTNISSMANRVSEKDRIASDFNYQRATHDAMTVPPSVALDWVINNTVADCLAQYLVNLFDAQYLNGQNRGDVDMIKTNNMRRDV